MIKAKDNIIQLPNDCSNWNPWRRYVFLIRDERVPSFIEQPRQAVSLQPAALAAKSQHFPLLRTSPPPSW